MKIAINVTTLEEKPYRIEVTDDLIAKNNYIKVRKFLEYQRQRIIDKLKEYKNAGFINSIKRPVNKTMQNQLDFLIKKKKILKKSINLIIQMFK